MVSVRSVVDSVFHDLLRCWQGLALTDILYKVIAFVLLTPIVAVLFRVFLAFSGRTVTREGPPLDRSTCWMPQARRDTIS